MQSFSTHFQNRPIPFATYCRQYTHLNENNNKLLLASYTGTCVINGHSVH